MATVYQGVESGYTGAVTVVRQLDAHLEMTDPKDFPLLQMVGLNSFPEEIYNTKVEWQQEKLTPLEDALNGSIDTTGETTITVDNAQHYSPYDVLMVEDELVRVLSVNLEDDELIVERGWAGSTAATHDDNDVVYTVGRALPEGSAPGVARQLGVYQPYNYTQIWDTVAHITGTEEALKNYAPEELMNHRMDKRLMELYQMMERSFIYGHRYASGTVNVGRSAGGLNEFITDENALSSAVLTEDHLIDALEDVFERAGLANMPTQLWSNSWAKRKISSWYTGYAQQDAARTVGGITIDTINTDFGQLEFHLDHLIKSDDLFILNPTYLYGGALRGRELRQEDASMPGTDAIKHRAIGEYTWIIKGEDGTNDGVHVHISGFSTSS